MRSRTWPAWAALGGLLALVPATARAQQQFTPTDLLTKFQPTQAGVEYETPADAKAVAACKVDFVKNTAGKTIGYALRDGQGKVLRRFVDTDGNVQIDQWSYYQDGFEVYREADTNGDRSVDECRWMNMNGTRIASVARGKVGAWKRLSPEEASKVLVQGIVLQDPSLVGSVFVTPEELESLGVPPAEVARVRDAGATRATETLALLKGLIGWDKQTAWLRFDGAMPRVIPQDAAAGLNQDVILYENAVVFAGDPSGGEDSSQVGYLQIPEMIKVGETWKFLDVPRPVDPKAERVDVSGRPVGLRTALYAQGGGGTVDPRLEAALKALADYDQKNAAMMAASEPRTVAGFYRDRVKLLRDVLAHAKADDLMYRRQVVDSIAAAYQTGAYPDGKAALDQVIAEGGKPAAYAAFRKALAEHALASEAPDANLIAEQKRLVEDLQAFVTNYPDSEETPEALLQLGNVNEFNADEEAAKGYYKQLAEKFPATDAGRKGIGALRRFGLVGQPLELKGTGIDGTPIDIATLKSKTVLVVFWASWAEQSKSDLPELKRVADKHKDRGFVVVGVSLDNDKAEAKATADSLGLAWPQLFEPGGIDSRPAQQFGIMSLPTLFLVGPDGVVVSRGMRSATELDKQLAKTLGGVAAREDEATKR